VGWTFTGASMLFYYRFSAHLSPTDPLFSIKGESGSAHLRAKTITLGTMGNACPGLASPQFFLTFSMPTKPISAPRPVRLRCLLVRSKFGANSLAGFIFFGLGVFCILCVYFFIPGKPSIKGWNAPTFKADPSPLQTSPADPSRRLTSCLLAASRLASLPRPPRLGSTAMIWRLARTNRARSFKE
jgi:hypothetical protein